MSTDNRQLLRKQLEQQAKLFTTGKSDIELIVSTLSTCSALIRATERSMPDTISQAEFDRIFAGYLGIAGSVDGFCKKNSLYFDPDKSETLQTFLASLSQAEIRKKKLDEELADAGRETEAVNSDIKNTEQLLETEQKKYHSLLEKENGLKEKLKAVTEKNKLLNENLEKISADIDNLEPNIERLIHEVENAKETYEEMTAYYSELQRIQDGIRDEGYVNLESFCDKIGSMNDSGKNLMAEYDSLLRSLTSDIESLQAKIENRIKAGAVV